MTFLKSKVMVLILALFVSAIAVGGIAYAAAQHAGPFSSPTTNATFQLNQALDQEEQTLVGVIQALDATKFQFTLLVDGQQQPVTITYDGKTKIVDIATKQTTTLAVKQHVKVALVKETDGTLYAAEVTVNPPPATKDDPDHETIPLQGIVSAVTTTTFTLVPEDKKATFTIAYDAKTELEFEHGTGKIEVGSHVWADVTKQANGTLYALEVRILLGNETEGTEVSHPGTPAAGTSTPHGQDGTKTPEPGDHGNGTPGPTNGTPGPDDGHHGNGTPGPTNGTPGPDDGHHDDGTKTPPPGHASSPTPTTTATAQD